MKINYDLKLKEELEKIKGTKPTLLLHVCCGPCSGNVLKEISEFFDITIYYSNSNIYPDTEYFRRFHELENFIQRFNQDFNQNIQVVEKEYQPKEYLKDISQYKDEPEGGKRCYLCYSKRMKDAYDYASLHHFDYWSTVLSVSPHKNSQWINEIGASFPQEKTQFVAPVFKAPEDMPAPTYMTENPIKAQTEGVTRKMTSPWADGAEEKHKEKKNSVSPWSHKGGQS